MCDLIHNRRPNTNTNEPATHIYLAIETNEQTNKKASRLLLCARTYARMSQPRDDYNKWKQTDDKKMYISAKQWEEQKEVVMFVFMFS